MADTEFDHTVKLELETDFESENNYGHYEDNNFMNVKSEFDLDYQNEDLYNEPVKEEYTHDDYENYEFAEEGEDDHECK